MSSFRSRARKFAFGDSQETLSESSSVRSCSRSDQSSVGKTGLFRKSSSTSEVCHCGHDEKYRTAPKRTNKVRKLNRSLPFEQFVEALEEDGCVIVEDFVNPQISQRVVSAEETNAEPEDERISRSTTIDVNEFIRDSLVSDTLFHLLSTHFLCLESVCYHGKRPQHKSAWPKLSRSTTVDLTHQRFEFDNDSAHFRREDCVYHQRHTASNKYDYASRRDATLGLFVPELDSLSASIPIKMIPGSHLWDDSKPDVSRGICDIELHGGDALILLGSLYHQTGADSEKGLAMVETGSGTPREKLMHQIWMSSGILRRADELEHDEAE